MHWTVSGCLLYYVRVSRDKHAPRPEDPPRLGNHAEPVVAHEAEAAHDDVDDRPSVAIAVRACRPRQRDALRALRLVNPGQLLDEIVAEDCEPARDERLRQLPVAAA